MPAYDLSSTYLRLRPDSSIEKLPVDGFWPRLMRGELGNFHHEYLVTMSESGADWPSWEMHPNGDEIVCLVAGRATLIIEGLDGARSENELAQPGSFAFIPRGCWHTARVAAASRFFFITAGEGTQHRPVQA